MKLKKVIATLFVCILLFGLVTIASAGPPPQGDDPPPGEEGFDPAPIQPGRLVLERSTGRIIHAELASDAGPSAQSGERSQAVKPDEPASAAFGAPGPEAKTINLALGSTLDVQDMTIGGPLRSGARGDEINAASSTVITTEGFEGAFPTGLWALEGTHDWGDVNCFPWDGSWSAWPATNVANPCAGANYPDNMIADLKYGPFDLSDAQSASLDFYFRLDSQSCDPVTDCDFLFWGASTNGSSYYGEFAAGTFTSGPFLNGYNFASLDLSSWVGEPQVWILISFRSNGDGITGQGPFVDFISLRKNSDPRVVLTDENFDVAIFPNPSWESTDENGTANGEYLWDDAFCNSRSGFFAMWPAYGGADWRDPCFAGEPYADNMESWLVHGPLDLTGASEAWVDFYFRNESEEDYDWLYWIAATPSSLFNGWGASGDIDQGPYYNGYNLVRFNLGDVPGLGDLRGEPEVWLAFVFQSDWSITGQGPFLDDVTVVIEKETQTPLKRRYLPFLYKNSAPITNLYVTNNTGGTLTYTVRGTPEGTKSCSVENNQQKLCATFSPGTYDWEAQAHCGTAYGTRYYPPGDDYPKAFQCQ